MKEVHKRHCSTWDGLSVWSSQNGHCGARIVGNGADFGRSCIAATAVRASRQYRGGEITDGAALNRREKGSSNVYVVLQLLSRVHALIRVQDRDSTGYSFELRIQGALCLVDVQSRPDSTD